MSARPVIAPGIAPVIAIDPNLCTGCRRCAEVCPVGAVSGPQGQPQAIDADRCVLCGQCVQACYAFAAPFDEPAHDPAAIRRQRGLPEAAGPVFAAHARCDLDIAKALVADPSRGAQLLGWKPQKSSLLQIVQDAAAWHRSQRYGRNAVSVATPAAHHQHVRVVAAG